MFLEHRRQQGRTNASGAPAERGATLWRGGGALMMDDEGEEEEEKKLKVGLDEA
jgi:hypothetical protein